MPDVIGKHDRLDPAVREFDQKLRWNSYSRIHLPSEPLHRSIRKKPQGRQRNLNRQKQHKKYCRPPFWGRPTVIGRIKFIAHSK